MKMENGRGTSRSGFLKQAAGATVVVAGAGAGVGAFAAGAAAASSGRTYTSGRFAFDLQGFSCGRIPGVDGGILDHAVALDGLGPDHYQKKHIANVKYEDFT